MDSTTQKESEKRRLKAEISSAVRRWVKLLNLNEHHIRVDFTSFGNESGYGSCRCLSAYRSCILEFDLDRIPPHEDVDQLVVHELVHILTMPLHEHAAIGCTPKEEDVLDMQAERVVHDIATRIVHMVAGKTFPRLQFMKGAVADAPSAGN